MAELANKNGDGEHATRVETLHVGRDASVRL